MKCFVKGRTSGMVIGGEGDVMAIRYQARVLVMLLLPSLFMAAAPVSGEETPPVIGATPPLHDAAPQAPDGQGDYGFAGQTRMKQTGNSGGVLEPDEDLLAYEEEEAAIEAEAAIALDDTVDPVVVVD